MPPLLRACFSFLPFLLHQRLHKLQGREGIVVVLQLPGRAQLEAQHRLGTEMGKQRGDQGAEEPGEIKHCALEPATREKW